MSIAKLISACLLAGSLIWPASAAETLLPPPDLKEDGLYHPNWFLFSFMDLAEDAAEAQSRNKQLVVVFEQPGCGPCKRVHEVNLRIPKVVDTIRDNFEVVRMNLVGAHEVTDFDGQVLTEKEYARKIGVRGTPTFVFYKDAGQFTGGGADAVAWRFAGYLEPQTFTDAFVFTKARAYVDGNDFRSWAKNAPGRVMVE